MMSSGRARWRAGLAAALVLLVAACDSAAGSSADAVDGGPSGDADVSPPDPVLAWAEAFAAEPRDPAFADCAEARLRTDFAVFDAAHDELRGVLEVECRTAQCRVDIRAEEGSTEVVFASLEFHSVFTWPCLVSTLGHVAELGDPVGPAADGPVMVLAFRCDCGETCYAMPLAQPADACTANLPDGE